MVIQKQMYFKSLANLNRTSLTGQSTQPPNESKWRHYVVPPRGPPAQTPPPTKTLLSRLPNTKLAVSHLDSVIISDKCMTHEGHCHLVEDLSNEWDTI